MLVLDILFFGSSPSIFLNCTNKKLDFISLLIPTIILKQTIKIYL